MSSHQGRYWFAVIIGLFLVFAGLNVQHSSAQEYYFDLTNIRSAQCDGDGGSFVWDANYNVPNNTKFHIIMTGSPAGAFDNIGLYPSVGSVDSTKHTHSRLVYWTISPDYVFEGTPKYYSIHLFVKVYATRNGIIYFSDGFNIEARCSGTSIIFGYSQ